MRHFILLLGLFILSSCQTGSKGYQAKSVAEARAYAKRAVELGIVHSGGEAELLARKSVGKPLEGTWDSQKIERFAAKFINANPRLVEINLAATKGTITERDRLILVAELESSEAAQAEERAARMQAIAAGLNNASASLNRSTAQMNQNTARILTTPTYTPRYSTYPAYSPPRTINLYPTYGGGYRGTIH